MQVEVGGYALGVTDARQSSEYQDAVVAGQDSCNLVGVSFSEECGRHCDMIIRYSGSAKRGDHSPHWRLALPESCELNAERTPALFGSGCAGLGIMANQKSGKNRKKKVRRRERHKKIRDVIRKLDRQ
jgi:hypothetical protein